MMEFQPLSSEIVGETEATVVAIDSNSDEITRAALSYRMQHVYPFLESKGFKLAHFLEADATRENVYKAAAQPDVIYLTGGGHGKADTYLIDHHDPIFQLGQYDPNVVRGKVIHFLSCQTARELGADFVANGCLAFFGYEDDFVFLPEDASVFFECDAEIDRAFADGLTAEEVHDRVKEIFLLRAAELYAQGRVYTANLLEDNLACLRSPAISTKWGDSQASIYPPPPNH